MFPQRCPHFSILIQMIENPDALYLLRTPIYHCAATTQIVQRLQIQEEGEEIAGLLSRSGPDGEIYPRCGPDLMPLSPNYCTCERYSERCEAGFAELMASFCQDAMQLPALERAS